MELHRIRGGSRETLETRQYSIAIGVSLGNKWFTVGNILGLVEWALPYTRSNVMVYVADTIHAINVEIRKRIPYGEALQEAKKMGANLLDAVRKKIEHGPLHEHKDRIRFATWDDLVDDAYREKVKYLKILYESGPGFSNTIKQFVQNHLSKGNRSFGSEDIHALGMYIIEELPELINRVPISGEIYDAWVYPHDSELAEFIENIQNGKVFPEIKQHIMDTDPKVFLEVR